MAIKNFAMQNRTSQLHQCGRHWGENVNLGTESSYIGSTDWYETAVSGVLGLDGNHPGKGPGIILKDIEHQNINILWTEGLLGCMCLAITGTDEEGKLDVFFSHARHYDKETAATDKDNPIYLAKQFVATHEQIRVFWGTDFFVGNNPLSSQAIRDSAQQKLSNDLGCWVRDNDCIPASKLVFFPKLGILRSGKPADVQQELSIDEDLKDKIEFSKSKCLSKFIPDLELIKKIELQLANLIIQRNSLFRLWHQDGLRSNKILVLQKVLAAYQVGNINVLRYFACHAQKKTSPFIDLEGANVWYAREKSNTAQLVQEAFKDAHTKIYSMGTKGCGLRSDGNDIYNLSEFKRITEKSNLTL
ncbi:hypothetical protein ACNVED_14925 (plasmid) [Legionella sp. D16C41]|uniref:hypothetical protein n=1 Tax=Legionella sp. D16C41 TaxID=3402688 RepID=UPI003AF777E8